jgi:peptide/nickel transport system permease protein
MLVRLVSRRLLQALPVILGASFLTFVLVNLLPGTVVLSILGTDPTPQAVNSLNHELGLDQPLMLRYFKWLGHAFQGQLGVSITWHQPVAALIGQRLPVTAELVILGIVVALVPAVIVSCIAARRPRGLVDQLLSVVSIFGISVPNFLLALGLIYVFAVVFHLLPPLGFVPLSRSLVGNLKSITLPVITLAAGLFAAYTRVLKADMTEQVSNEEYINTARSKGTKEWTVVRRHVLRNSSFSLITIVALNLGVLLGATVILEQVYALPGIGQLLISAINERDQPVVEGIVLCLSIAVILMNLLADVAYYVIDPRVRHGAQ